MLLGLFTLPSLLAVCEFCTTTSVLDSGLGTHGIFLHCKSGLALSQSIEAVRVCDFGQEGEIHLFEYIICRVYFHKYNLVIRQKICFIT
jgi:hypothetical protein